MLSNWYRIAEICDHDNGVENHVFNESSSGIDESRELFPVKPDDKSFARARDRAPNQIRFRSN